MLMKEDNIRPILRLHNNRYISAGSDVILGGLVVSVLVIGPKACGFKPGREQWIFKGYKNPQQHFLRRGNKVVGSSGIRVFSILRNSSKYERDT
jgi:hypothetical protein